MKSLILALALMTGCAPTYTQITKRCPTMTMELADFFLGGAFLVVSAFKWADEKPLESVAWTSGAGAIWLGDSWAEIRGCKR